MKMDAYVVYEELQSHKRTSELRNNEHVFALLFH